MAGQFAVGAYYTNQEITAALGGTIQNYLRHIPGQRIIAICLNPWEHPRAPDEIWVGAGGNRDLVGRSAQWLVEQCAGDPAAGVPLFIKDGGAHRGLRSWRYYGRYRVREDTRDEARVAALAGQRKDPVRRILYLEQVSE